MLCWRRAELQCQAGDHSIVQEPAARLQQVSKPPSNQSVAKCRSHF